ncbi:MASE1 domain-containing protein [Edwardsiella anguillarum]|nr:MASE1 domain-containing protein [Edwardsiella anguillarum]
MASNSPCIRDEVHPAPWQLMLFAAVNALLALVSLLLIRSDAALPSLWLPTAATTAILFHCRQRDWPRLVGISLLSSLLPLLLSPTYFPPLHYGLLHALIDQLQALLCALALRRCLHGSPLGQPDAMGLLYPDRRAGHSTAVRHPGGGRRHATAPGCLPQRCRIRLYV